MHRWTASAVKELVDQRLGDASLFVVSNRELWHRAPGAANVRVRVLNETASRWRVVNQAV